MKILKSSNNNLDEIVFENRNKEYGAYALRKNADTYTNLGVVYTLSPFVILCVIVLLFQHNHTSLTPIANNVTTDVKKIIDDVAVRIDNIIIIPDNPVQPSVSTEIDYRKIIKDNKVKPTIKKQPELSSNIPTRGTNLTSLAGSAGIGSIPFGNIPKGNFPTIKTSEKLYDFVETMPQFPGGMEAMYTYITNNLVYPKIARESGRTGKVVLSFVIMPDGSINNIMVEQGIGFGCDDEAKRVVREMPNWSPGMQNGSKVAVRLLLPIDFTQE